MDQKNNPNLFQGKYRIETVRAKWWEYYEGIYHITMVTDKRRHYFGEIDNQNGKNVMHLSTIGQFVNDEIPKIADHYPYAFVPVWAVMPDHIHLLIIIDRRGRDYPKTPSYPDFVDIMDCDADIRRDVNPQKREDIKEQMSKIAPKTGSLGLIMGRFKQSVTVYARTHQIPFKWQPRFYDVILFDQIGFERTKRYIENNVAKWPCKKENPLPDWE